MSNTTIALICLIAAAFFCVIAWFVYRNDPFAERWAVIYMLLGLAFVIGGLVAL
jgi:hypothetical protein